MTESLTDAVIEDVRRTPWPIRLRTIAVTTGVMAFGMMLGAHVMAADLLFGVALPPLQPRYELLMNWGMYAGAGGLVVGVVLEFLYVREVADE